MATQPIAAKPERRKKPGVHYAVTNQGVELPVVDVTHPEFALSDDAAEFFKKRDAFAEMHRRRGKPGPYRRLLERIVLRDSVLWRGLRGASGGFLAGMDTYLFKLGPANLGRAYSSFGDRLIARSYPVTAIRIRLRETSRMIADGLGPLLSSRPGSPLHMVNIAGGHASDSLNALILCRRAHPELLEGRRIELHVLDLEKDAPDFGERALAALRSDSGPLSGLKVTLNYARYDWRQPSSLAELIAGFGPDSAAVASTEGGLFEYGSDEDIASNLAALAKASRAGMFVVGSVTRDDDFGRQMRRNGGIAVIRRGLARFSELVRSSGWSIGEAVELPFCDVVRLAPTVI